MDGDLMGNVRALASLGNKPLTSNNTFEEFETKRVLVEELVRSYRKFCAGETGGASDEILEKKSIADRYMIDVLGQEWFNDIFLRMSMLANNRILKGPSFRPINFEGNKLPPKNIMAAIHMPFIAMNNLAHGGLSKQFDKWANGVSQQERDYGRPYYRAHIACAYNSALCNPRDGIRVRMDGTAGYMNRMDEWKHIKYNTATYSGSYEGRLMISGQDNSATNHISAHKDASIRVDDVLPFDVTLANNSGRVMDKFLSMSPAHTTSILGNHNGSYLGPETKELVVRLIHSSVLNEYHPDYKVSSWQRPDVLLSLTEGSLDSFMDSHPDEEWDDSEYSATGKMEALMSAVEDAVFLTVIYDHDGYVDVVEGELFDIDPFIVGVETGAGCFYDLWE